MTRVNCIPVGELHNKHLVAEYREITRMFSYARKSTAKHGALMLLFDQPDNYCLGKGHMLFFYNKLGYIRRRHAELVEEMKARGYKPTIDCSENGLDLPDWMQNDWEPDEAALAINRKRINERLQEMKTVE